MSNFLDLRRLATRSWLLAPVAAIIWSAVVLAQQASAPVPMVAVHVSELTQALATMNATPPTPTGAGTTGRQWWYTSWQYLTAPESLKEALRSDGTPFVVVTDSDIAAGSLRNADGSPRYPIVVSLAAEAIADNEIAPLRDYVNAGGFLFMGSSAFTRRPDGTARGNFALATEMGLTMASPSLDNWYDNSHLTKAAEHRLTSHLPDGTVNWRGPLYADQIPWGPDPSVTGYSQVNSDHPVWDVLGAGAQVLASGDSGPLLTAKGYGQGQFIYDGTFQPLIGHSSLDPSMYRYVVFRRAIEWAFEAAGAPIVKVSPWPYQYDAAFNARHDFENDPSLINAIESSAQFEKSVGAKGDYYFSTGALRADMFNNAATIASLRRAVTNHGATIGSHNGGLQNPVTNLSQLDYGYWHWGPDSAIDTTPAGYSSGKAYAQASVLKSFQDIEGWLSGVDNGRAGCGAANTCPRIWVSPFFNSAREASLDALNQVGTKVTGERKISPFPHWPIKYGTPATRHPHLSLPQSEWYVGSDVVQALNTPYGGPNSNHTVSTVTDGVDFYHGIGALLNFYSHTVANDGALFQHYVTYSLTKPRVWSTNAVGVYDWWVARSPVRVVPTITQTGGGVTITAAVTGSTNSATAIELVVPGAGTPTFNLIRVLLNGAAAPTADYRLTTYGLKVRVGTSVSTVVVEYASESPVAVDDDYETPVGALLSRPAASGVLSNDVAPTGQTLSAQLVTNPSHGSLVLNPDGSFIYTPAQGYVGLDSFTYLASDGAHNSNVATAEVNVTTAVSAFPSGVTILSGTLNGGSATSLASDNAVYYAVNSTTSGTRTSSWYGSFTGVNATLTNLKVNYQGNNSGSCTQTIAIYRWTDATYVQLDSRSVSTTDVTISGLTPTGTLANYVSGTGELRVRVMCTRTSNFIARGDLMSINYDVPPPPDTIAPVRSGGTPSGVLGAGTTQAMMSLTTNEAATCKYGPVAGTAYAALPTTFTTTGNTTHAVQLTGFTNGSSYTYYVRCRDASANLNTNADDYVIAFTVATPPAPPALASLTPTSGPVGTSVTVTGTNFGATQGTGTVTFSGTPGTPTSWGATSIAVPVPAGAITGSVVVTVGGQTSNGLTFTVTAPPPPPGGLVAAFNFEEASGVTVTDVSGNGNTGTITAATRTTGKYGNGLSFNGTSAYVSVPDAASLDLGATGSIAAWVNQTTASDNGGLVHKGQAANFADEAYSLQFSGTSRRPELWLVSASASNVVTAPGALSLATWHHVAVTWDSTGVKIYINGVLDTSTTGAFTPRNSTGALFLGAQTPGQNGFAGTLDEIRVYNRALSLTEVQAAMNAPLGGGAPPDTTPPTVSTVTAPPSPLSGTVTLSATASDNSGTAPTVQFLLNGQPLGAPVAGPSPYALQWNTTTVANGPYTLAARATDGAGLSTTSTTVNVTVSNAAPPPAPTLSSLAPTSGPVGTSVTVTGTNFGATQGTSTVTFNGTLATPTSWSATSVAVPVPAGATTGSVVVTVGGQTSNGLTFTVTAPPPPPGGLVAAFNFEEASGATVTDVSGNGNTGTITAATRTAGKYGNGLSFNGTSAYVSVPDAASLDLGATGSIAAWVYQTAASDHGGVVHKGQAADFADEAFSLQFSGTSRRPELWLVSASTSKVVTATPAGVLSLATWHHVAVTWDSTGVKIYINGVLDTSSAGAFTPRNSTGALFLGAQTPGQNSFAGTLDDIRVYNRALSLTEVQAAMNALVGP